MSEDTFNHLVQIDKQFSEITTLGIGGLIQNYYEAKDESSLIEMIRFAEQRNIKYFVVGGCSNLLVSDEGVDCLIIKNLVTGIKGENSTVSVKAGTTLQELVDFTVEKGLSGLQKLTGIPGTVGGAIYGNAGAYGQTISDHLESVSCLTGKEIITLTKDECGFNYRDSNFKKTKYIILEAKFTLTEGNKELLKQDVAETLSTRLAKYPPGLKCPGSFFKNVLESDLPAETLALIPNDKINHGKIPAGYLLEAVGARGKSLGGIKISENHGNLIINTGDGTASEFYKLASAYAQKVKEKFNIRLEPEVQLINLPSIE